MRLSEKQKDRLRAEILETCKSGKSMEALTQAVSNRDYDLVREMARALATAGLLVTTGKTQGTIYRTTKLGREMIPAFRNRKYPGRQS